MSKRGLPILIIAAVLVLTLVAVWYLKRSPNEFPHAGSASAPATPAGSVKLGAEPPQSLGDTAAPVMLEEFGDFECSSCASVHPVLKTMKAEFGTRLVIVFREFPLVSVHAQALPAARAAEAAGLQGKFWQMHDLLYENQKAWHEASDASVIFEQYAGALGLDLPRYKRDITSDEVERRIRSDRERGNWIGVTETPSVFLNGREAPIESLTAEQLRGLINAQLTNSH